ncbi:hypothetical protein AgCh_014528 [Apium graveolens]
MQCGKLMFHHGNVKERDTVGKLKPMSTNLCIRLLGSTFIQCVEDYGMIPRYKFEFMDLADLGEETKHLGENENLEFDTDLIGVIDAYEKVNRISTKYGPRDVVRFMLTDERVFQKVSIGGELAIAVNEAFIKSEEKPIIAIVTSTNYIHSEDIPIPDILNEIVHKELTVSIEINEANVTNDNNLYEVVDLLDSSAASSSITDYSPVPKCPSFDKVVVNTFL